MRSQSFNLAHELLDADGAPAFERQEVGRKQYRRNRSLRTARRRSSRMAGSHPDLGIAGRRNHRWSW
jgi:hypothetical protein